MNISEVVVSEITSALINRDFQKVREMLKRISIPVSKIEIKKYREEYFILIGTLIFHHFSNSELRFLHQVFNRKGGNITFFFDKVYFYRFYYKLLYDNLEFEEIERTMSGTLCHFYDSELYYLYGLYSIEIGEIQRARKFIFLSGIEDDTTKEYSEAFFNQLKNGHGNQIIGLSCSQFIQRHNREKIPRLLKEKLKQLYAPNWLTR